MGRKANGKLKQVMIMRWLRAPLAKVYKTIAQMEKYPTFLPNVRKVKILKRSPKSFEASMTTAVAMIQMSWVTRVKSPQPGRSKAWRLCSNAGIWLNALRRHVER